MMFSKLNKYFNYIIFLILIIVSFIWSTHLFRSWGTDFGNYYSSSKFLFEDYSIYTDFFTHKGPVFINFLSLLGSIYGWGVLESFFTLSFICSIFLIINFIVVINFNENKYIIVILTSILIALLYNSSSHLAIALFQTSLISFSYIFLNASLNKINQLNIYIIISLIFFSFAVLTRIDTLIYSFVYLYFIVNLKIKEILLFIGLSIFIFFLIFYIFLLTNNYTIHDYFTHNIDFNFRYISNYIDQLYSNESNWIVKYFYRRNSFIILSLLLIPFFIIIILSTSINKIKNKKFILDVLSLIIIPCIFWIYTKSDTSSHLLMVTYPSFLFLCLYLKKIDFINKIKYFLIIHYLYLIFLTLGPGFKSINYLFKENIEINNLDKVEIIDYLKESGVKEYFTIGSEGWIYVFSNLKNKGSTNNAWFYIEPSYETKGLLNQHQNLLHENGALVLIDLSIVEDYKVSDKFNEIINNSNSIFISKNTQYEIRKIL